MLKLCNKDPIEYITSIGYICDTIIPETVRFTTSNCLNSYPNIGNICVGSHGYLFFLTHDKTRKLSNIYKCKVHNPVQDITLVCLNVKGTEIHFHEGLLYFTGNSLPLSIAVINKKSDPTFNIGRIKSNKEILAHMQKLNLETNGTLKCLKSSLAKHQENAKKMYKKITRIQL